MLPQSTVATALIFNWVLPPLLIAAESSAINFATAASSHKGLDPGYFQGEIQLNNILCIRVL